MQRLIYKNLERLLKHSLPPLTQSNLETKSLELKSWDLLLMVRSPCTGLNQERRDYRRFPKETKADTVQEIQFRECRLVLAQTQSLKPRKRDQKLQREQVVATTQTEEFQEVEAKKLINHLWTTWLKEVSIFHHIKFKTPREYQLKILLNMMIPRAREVLNSRIIGKICQTISLAWAIWKVLEHQTFKTEEHLLFVTDLRGEIMELMLNNHLRGHHLLNRSHQEMLEWTLVNTIELNKQNSPKF